MKIKLLALSLLVSLGTLNTDATDKGDPKNSQEGSPSSPRLQLNLDQTSPQSDDEKKGEELRSESQGNERLGLMNSQETQESSDLNDSHPLLMEVITRNILAYLDAQSALRFALSCQPIRDILYEDSTWQSLRQNPPTELGRIGTNFQGIRYLVLKAFNQFVTEVNALGETNPDLANLTPDVLIASFGLCQTLDINDAFDRAGIIRVVLSIPQDPCEVVRSATLLLSGTSDRYLNDAHALVTCVGNLRGDRHEICSKLRSLLSPSEYLMNINKTLELIAEDPNHNVVLLSAEDLINHPHAREMQIFNVTRTYECFAQLGKDSWVIWSTIKHLMEKDGQFHSVIDLAEVFKEISSYGENALLNCQAVAALSEPGEGFHHFRRYVIPNRNLLPVVSRLGQDRAKLCTAAKHLLSGDFINPREVEELLTGIQAIPNYEKLCPLAAKFIIDRYTHLEQSNEDKLSVLKTFQILGLNLEATLEASNIILKHRFKPYFGAKYGDKDSIMLDLGQRLELLKAIDNLGEDATRTLTLSVNFMYQNTTIDQIKTLFVLIKDLGSDGESVCSMTQTILEKIGRINQSKYIDLLSWLFLTVKDLGPDRESKLPKFLTDIEGVMADETLYTVDSKIDKIIAMAPKKK